MGGKHSSRAAGAGHGGSWRNERCNPCQTIGGRRPTGDARPRSSGHPEAPTPSTSPGTSRGAVAGGVESAGAVFADRGDVRAGGKQPLSDARYASRVEQTGDNPQRLLDEVLAQCVRDTTNPYSVLRGHSLLNDLYGNDGIKYSNPATPLTVTPVTTTGQLLDLTFTPAGAPSPPPPNLPSTRPAYIYYANFGTDPVWEIDRIDYPFSIGRLQSPGYYNGCVFTATGGAAHGKSTRILGWSYDAATLTYTARVLAFEGVALSDLTTNRPTGFVINGRPFNGTGFGFNTHAGVDPMALDETLLSAQELINTTPFPFAWLPNPIFADPTRLETTSCECRHHKHCLRAVRGAGGSRRGLRCARHTEHAAGSLAGGSSIGHGRSRPNYPLAAPSGNDCSWPGSRRRCRVGLRAAGRADASNGLAPAHGQRHSISASVVSPTQGHRGRAIRRRQRRRRDPESIWVDVGLPVRTAPDGRTYKPLVAILCLDLDGRLNVNAHGNIAHVDQYLLDNMHLALTSANIVVGNSKGGTLPDLKRGLGYGPAEISLYPLFSTSLTAPTTVLTPYSQLLGEPMANRI